MRSPVQIWLAAPKKDHPIGWSFSFGQWSDLNHQMQQSGGLLLESGWTDSTPYDLTPTDRQQIWLAAPQKLEIERFRAFFLYYH